MIYAKASRMQALKNQEKRNVLDTAQQEMFSLYQSGVSDPTQYRAIVNRYATADTFQALLHDASYFSNAFGSTTKVSDQEKIELMDKIDARQIADKDTLQAYMKERGFSASDFSKYSNMFDTAQKQIGKYQYDWQGLKDDAFTAWGSKDQQRWFFAKQDGEDFVREQFKKTGEYPSRHQVNQHIIESGKRPSVGWLSNTKDYTYWQKQGLAQTDMWAMGIFDMREHVVGGKTVIRFYTKGGTTDYTPSEANDIIKQQLSKK